MTLDGEMLRAEVAALRRQVQDTMLLAEMSATINMVFTNALLDILSRRGGLSRAEIVEELQTIPLRHLGARPDLEAMAHNIIAQLILALDGRSAFGGVSGHA